jgi:superfamily II DNA or RNA helicase
MTERAVRCKSLASAEAMQALFEKVRQHASRAAWSEGVELARAGAVTGERESAGEVVLRVAPRAGVVHPSVLLLPGDLAWECDCGSDDDPCAHVAAGVIALRGAAREGKPLSAPTTGAKGTVAYRFRTTPTGLALERAVVHAGGEKPLRTTLSALASGNKAGPPVAPTRLDLTVESTLGLEREGPLPRGILRALLPVLEGASEVTLDGARIATSREPVGSVARLADDASGFRLVVEPESRPERDLGGGFVLSGGVLRELAPPPLSGRERDELTGRGKHFTPDQAAELVADVLPSLRRRMPVVVESRRLPSTRAEPPRIAIETARAGDGLSVLATLVYGSPPCARVDAGRLVHLAGAVPLRDVAAEERLVARLADALGLVPGRRVELAPEAAIRFAERLARFDAQKTGDAERAFRLAPALEPELLLAGDDFRLRFRARLEDREREADPARVLAAFRRGDALVPLLGGGFAPLPADWLARFGGPLADLLAARSASGRLPAAALPDLARLAVLLDAPPPPGFERLRGLLSRDWPETPLPADLRAELRPYQREGFRWLAFLGRAGLGALLADDMGLGKTVQALAALQGRTLVVAPTSLLGNWEEEIARFRPGLRADVYHGAGRALDASADVTLTSYALLRRDRDVLGAVAWDTVVLDEAQAIKNPESQVARAAFALGGARRITLTGTPVENRLDELWSQLHFLNPGLLGGRSDFDERYARPLAAGDAAAGEQLRLRIRPFVLRRRKAEVAPELPPRTEAVLHAALSEEERAVYDALAASVRVEVLEQLGQPGGVLAALELLLRLRQACCHPRLLPGQTLDRSAKLELLVDRLETTAAEGHKALVFSQWTSLLDLVEPALGAAGLGFVRLDGATRDRSGVVASFQAASGPPVFLISLKAGGTGLNLTAADHVFLLDPWWNPAVEEQAADRAHRIGQDKPVFVYRLVAAGTVEERILALQAKKRALAEGALTGAGAAASLTREDLLSLLA